MEYVQVLATSASFSTYKFWANTPSTIPTISAHAHPVLTPTKSGHAYPL
jgi:hypothetical protein